MKKRLLSILLALCMVLTLLPGTAFAASGHHPFTDVADTDWYNSAVQYVYEHGMMSGTSSTKFSPDTATSRGMIVTILHRLEGTPSATGMTFTDVAAGEYYTNAVAWASANNIVNGYSSSTFGPNDPITREQLAAILYRYAQYKEYDTTITGSVTAFSDGGRVSSYAVSAVNWAIGVGLLQGVGNNMLSPASGANRAQAATMLMRFCENVATQGTPPDIEMSKDEIYSKELDENHVKTGTLEYDGQKYEGQYIDNELIVVIKDGVDRTYIEQLVAPHKGTIVGQIQTLGYYQIEFDTVMTSDILTGLAATLMRDSNIDDAYLNTVSEVETESYVPNDPWYNDNIDWNNAWAVDSAWGVKSIKAPAAWNLLINNYGSVSKVPSVPIGVIDTVFDMSNRDLLFEKVWCSQGVDMENVTNLAAKADTDELYSFYSHGTHVAGIIGAIHNNAYGISGVALNVKLYGVSMAKPFHPGANYSITAKNLFSQQTALALLIENGIRIINYSMGYPNNKSDTWRKSQAKSDGDKICSELSSYLSCNKDFLITVAGGNNSEGSRDASIQNAFASIENASVKSRIIIVGAVQNQTSGNYAYFKQFCQGWRVDVAAPGLGIYSTVPASAEHSEGKTVYWASGTSQAAPHVAGVAALVWAANPKLTGAQVKEIIVNTANIELVNKDDGGYSHNMINAEAAVYRALETAGTFYTPKVTLNFVDITTNEALKTGNLTGECVSYGSNALHEYNHSFNLNKLNFSINILNATENTTIDHHTLEMPCGDIKMKFTAAGYQETSVDFQVDRDTTEVTVYMIPIGETSPRPDPDPTDGYTESYKDILRQYPEYTDESWGKEYTEYTLYDIDKNDIPELIIRSDVWKYAVYTFDGRNSVLCGEIWDSYFGSYAELYAYDGNGIVIHFGGSGAMRIESLYARQLIDNVLTNEVPIASTEDMSFDEFYSMLAAYTLLNNFYRINDYTPFIE